mgnify:CR=1 FL=1
MGMNNLQRMAQQMQQFTSQMGLSYDQLKQAHDQFLLGQGQNQSQFLANLAENARQFGLGQQLTREQMGQAMNMFTMGVEDDRRGV